jgi:hypothetical protein
MTCGVVRGLIDAGADRGADQEDEAMAEQVRAEIVANVMGVLGE